MKQKNISKVDISIGSNMYDRITDFPNTASHVLAEFVDNALQSSLDMSSDLMCSEPNYRLRIDIDFLEKNEETNKFGKITIRDNAGGIDSDNFEKAFKLAYTPENNQGLNEFGMGLKTAALWLGKCWKLTTTALNEDVCRTVTFDLSKIIDEKLNEMEVISEDILPSEHFTQIEITSLTEKSPSKKNLAKIMEELSSIYRKFLQNDSVDIYVDGEKLTFERSEILVAPPAKNPKGKPVLWRRDIDFTFGKYSAKGFIALLKDINNTKNGIVLLRRGRVVYGAENDGRYFPKSICGNSGNFRYKRIFGELELEGFSVSYNKSDIQDKENLEALMELLRGEIHTKEFDLYSQAEDYRLDDRQRKINKIIKKINTNKKKNKKIEIVTTKKSEENNINDDKAKLTRHKDDSEPLSIAQAEETYTINGKSYRLDMEMVCGGKDLVWLNTSQKDDNVIKCKINVDHPFINHFRQHMDAIIPILKTLSLAKFITKEEGNDTTAEIFNNFNAYIKEIKV